MTSTDPKTTDPIVYEYDNAFIKVSANNVTSASTIFKRLTFREFLIQNDPKQVFGVILDTANTRDPTTQVITLNRPGLYDIKASIGKIGDGAQVAEIKLMAERPTGTGADDLSASLSLLPEDFTTLSVSSYHRVLPQDAGTRVSAAITSGAGGDTSIRGWSNVTNSYEALAQVSSYMSVTYLGP